MALYIYTHCAEVPHYTTHYTIHITHMATRTTETERNTSQPPVVSVNNLVCTWYIGCSDIDLHYIAQKAPFLSYDPHRFAAAICHMQSPKATCLLFNTGRGVCAGTKSKESAFYAVNQLISMIQRAGVFYGRVREFKVRNLVASSRCPFTVDLQRMSTSISSNCTYHAGLFPGLRFKPGLNGNKRQALLIYRNGGTVITGNSSVDECEALWSKVYGIICRYRTDMPVGMENSADYRIRMKIKACEKNKDGNHQDDNGNAPPPLHTGHNSKEQKVYCSDGDEDENTEHTPLDTQVVKRESTTHISDRCRVITRQVLTHHNHTKKRVDFSLLSMYEREEKRCRKSVALNPAIIGSVCEAPAH